MQEQQLPEDFKKKINAFVDDLKQLYVDDLISVILYGSIVSGEHSQAHSNINLLVVLKNTDLSTLERSRKLVHKFSNRRIDPLFLSRDFVLNFSHIFPIEFLDMQENYHCYYGADVLKEIKIDRKNLRFQCEQEFKSKLILLKQQYLRINPKDRQQLANFLFKSFTSVIHILRNVIRVKGKEPSYNKETVLREIAGELSVENPIFFKIWEIKRNSSKVKAEELNRLLVDFVFELDKITKKIDQL
ncbi:MAG: hypothetical protein HQL12_04580 [Candidatus Omnitrophica bacterium]|nr:hypothetical protein [Candidatus Omnitrophota bacterium]